MDLKHYFPMKTQVISTDPLGCTLVISHGTKQLYVHASEGGIKVFSKDGNFLGGRIVVASHTSGSIWHHDDCLGEYQFEEEGFEIIPISNGLKQPEIAINEHPLDFLINKISI